MIRTIFLTSLALFAYGCSADGESESSSQQDATAQGNNGIDSTVMSDMGIVSILYSGAVAMLDAGGAAMLDSGIVEDPDDCILMCQHMEMCGADCFLDDQGECLEIEGCAALCRTDVPPPTAACIAGLTACDPDEFQGCYDTNIGDDDCANTCRFLEACGECFLDEDNECLSLAACASVCRMVTPPATAQCIAQLTECSEIAPCYPQ